MGLTDEQVDSIVEMHTETVDGLKDKLKTAEEKANKLDDVQKELDGLKANSGDDWKSKYEKEHTDFESYKKGVTEKETKAAKEKAVKAYFEGKNITGANLDIAMRGCRDEIGAIELDGDKIKDTAALDALVSGTFAGLVVTKSVHGAQTANPPANNGGSKLTKADIFKKDDHGRYVMSTSERQKALAENPELMK
jgi:hypothetical protein